MLLTFPAGHFLLKIECLAFISRLQRRAKVFRQIRLLREKLLAL